MSQESTGRAVCVECGKPATHYKLAKTETYRMADPKNPPMNGPGLLLAAENDTLIDSSLDGLEGYYCSKCWDK